MPHNLTGSPHLADNFQKYLSVYRENYLKKIIPPKIRYLVVSPWKKSIYGNTNHSYYLNRNRKI